MPALPSDRHLTGQSKIESYGWKLKDAPGEMISLPKSMLAVDDSYQRDVSNNRAIAIAKNWSWLACGVLVVARRSSDQTYYVVDGQHRLNAARKRSDIDRLPCIVFETDDACQEAGGFYDLNTGRRPPTTFEKWRAQLLRGDLDTVFADRLIRDAGRIPSSSTTGAGEVRCLSTMLRMVQSNRMALVQVWPIVIEVCRDQTLHEILLQGLYWLETNLPEGQSLRDKRWRERVLQAGYDSLMEGARRAASFYARGGAKVFAKGMVEVLNKGRRIKLVLRDEEVE
jgi:hypothetical protein